MDLTNTSLFTEIMPLLLPPGLIGLFILIKYRSSKFAKFTGLLTLKPLIATPIWFYIYNVYSRNYNTCEIHPAYIFTALPGLGITILLVLFFSKELFGRNRKLVYILIFLDTIRWSNSVIFFPHCPPLHELWKVIFPALFGLAFPTIFSLVAIYFIIKKENKIAQN